MKVIPIPQLVDNYAYLIIDERGDGKSIAAAVDVADASAVVATARAHRATLAAVLTTHHHQYIILYALFFLSVLIRSRCGRCDA